MICTNNTLASVSFWEINLHALFVEMLIIISLYTIMQLKWQ